MPTQAEIEDFVRRNGEADRGRAVEALTNYTGDRDFDSQSANYDQRTNQLSPQGQAATAQIVRQPRQLSDLLAPNKAGSGPMGAVQLTNQYHGPVGTKPGDPVFLGGTGFSGGMVIGHYGPNGEVIRDGFGLASGGAPVSTGMPVGGGPTLASLLDYAPSFQQFRVR